MAPIELPDGMCGACGLRRLGDDITDEQVAELADALVRFFREDFERLQILRRRHGRKRPVERHR